MKKVFYVLTIIAMIACTSNSKIDYPYSFIGKEIENNGNTMELYTVQSIVNIDSLKMFCLEKKGIFQEVHFIT